MAIKLVEGAQKTRRRVDGQTQLPKLIANVKFEDGIRYSGNSRQRSGGILRRRGGVNPATFEAEPFRTLIRRGAAGDGCGGDLSDGSTVSIRRGKSRREAAQVFGLSRDTIAKMFR
jgi:hypothetical protein